MLWIDVYWKKMRFGRHPGEAIYPSPRSQISSIKPLKILSSYFFLFSRIKNSLSCQYTIFYSYLVKKNTLISEPTKRRILVKFAQNRHVISREVFESEVHKTSFYLAIYFLFIAHLFGKKPNAQDEKKNTKLFFNWIRSLKAPSMQTQTKRVDRNHAT